MNFHVLDTRVASMIVDERTNLAPYLPHLQNELSVLPFQTVAGLRLGAVLANWGEVRRTRLERFFTNILIQNSSEDLVNCWVRVMKEARQTGKRLEAADAWIAATALLLKTPLLTHDKDFSAESCSSIVVNYAATSTV